MTTDLPRLARASAGAALLLAVCLLLAPAGPPARAAAQPQAARTLRRCRLADHAKQPRCSEAHRALERARARLRRARRKLPRASVAYRVRASARAAASSTPVPIGDRAVSPGLQGSDPGSDPLSAPSPAGAPAEGEASKPAGEEAVEVGGRHVIIGVVDGSGWGAEVAGRVREAGFESERLEAGNPWGDTMGQSYAYGFRNDQIIVGNTPDGSPLSAIEIGPWVSTALAQVKEAAAYGYTLLEVGNEMYLKGGQAEPVKYAEMYMSLANAVDAAKITGVTLIFDSFGDYELPSGEWSLTAGGRGWLGDALKAQPALKQRVQAFSDHPYDLPGTVYYDDDWGMEGLRAQHAAAVALGFAHTNVYATEYGEKDRSPGTEAGAREQAENLKWGYEELLSMPYVKGIWCYTLHEDSSGEDYGLVSGTWEPRPALAVLEGFLHSVAQ